jgi:hypothetical protein
VAAIIVATMVATTQATTIPTRRIMPILCPRRPVSRDNGPLTDGQIMVQTLSREGVPVS